MVSAIRAILLEGLEQKVHVLNGARSAAAKPARGWIRAIRESIGVTQAAAAARIGVKRQSFAQFETAEEGGSISLASLSRAAGAIDCDLVYFLVPRGSGDRSFTDLARAEDPLALHQSATQHSMSLSDPAPRS